MSLIFSSATTCDTVELSGHTTHQTLRHAGSPSAFSFHVILIRMRIQNGVFQKPDKMSRKFRYTATILISLVIDIVCIMIVKLVFEERSLINSRKPSHEKEKWAIKSRDCTKPLRFSNVKMEIIFKFKTF